MPEEPRQIAWLIPGNVEIESMLSIVNNYLVKEIPKEWGNIKQILVTNTKQYEGFPGDTYRVRDELISGPSLFERQRDILMAASAENLIHDSDIIIVPYISTATLIRLLDFGGLTKRGTWLRRKPIIVVSPKAPTGNDKDVDEDEVLWYTVSTTENIWICTLDTPWEKHIMLTHMREIVPSMRQEDHVFDLALWKFDGFKDDITQKEEVIVWQGRNNIPKGYLEAVEVLTLLSGQGFKCRMFIPSANSEDAREIPLINKKLFECHLGMDRSLYFEEIKKAKACLISSVSEAFPSGYLEQIESGCIPVIKKYPWMKDFLTEKWPLTYKTKGEAVELLKEALENYDYYRDLLEKSLYERYNRNPDFGEVLRIAWNQYLDTHYKRYSLRCD